MDNENINKLIGKVVFTYEICDFKDELWAKIDKLCKEQKRSAIRLSLNRRAVWGVAASLAIIVSALLSVELSKCVVTAGDSDIAYVLPGNSDGTLYANSTLRYNKLLWIFKRDIELDGKAFFNVNVENGRRFNVTTTRGDIMVLGTEFMVNNSAEILSVECYSGSVKVETTFGEQILCQGEMVNCDDGGMYFSRIEEELPDYLFFEEGSLSAALEKVSDIYGVHFDGMERYAKYEYSGVIPTRNLEEALMVILGSCDIRYNMTDATVELKSK